MHSDGQGRRLTEVVASTAARVEARLNELKAENAKLRGFVETVASQNRLAGFDDGWILNDLIDEALEVLVEIA